MCMEDYRMGKRKFSASRIINVGVGVTQKIINPSVNRVHISVGGAGGAGSICPSLVTDGGLAGYYVGDSAAPVEIDLERHGSVVCEAWSVCAGAAGVKIVIVETFFDPEGKD